MKFCQICIAVVAAAFISTAAPIVCMAQEAEAYPFEAVNRPQTAVHKLGRGISGFVTSWVEVPKHLVRSYEGSEGLERFYKPFGGLMRGLGLCIERMGIGVYEVVTFPVPIPAHYASSYEAMGLQDSAYR